MNNEKYTCGPSKNILSQPSMGSIGSGYWILRNLFLYWVLNEISLSTSYRITCCVLTIIQNFLILGINQDLFWYRVLSETFLDTEY